MIKIDVTILKYPYMLRNMLHLTKHIFFYVNEASMSLSRES